LKQKRKESFGVFITRPYYTHSELARIEIKLIVWRAK